MPNCILDGEILFISKETGQFLPFADMSRTFINVDEEIAFEKVYPLVMVFDLIKLDNDSLVC